MKANLGASLSGLAEHLEDDAAIINNDIEFHLLVAEMTGNEALSLAVAPIAALLFSATVPLYRAVPAARYRLHEAHRAIAAAIVAGDADEAERWMERHIRDFRRGYEIGGLDMDAPIRMDPSLLPR
jgi:DNA-binding FadR family transcriptional regulator